MLQITRPACEHLRQMLTHAPEGVAVRLYLQYNDLAIAVDEVYDDDLSCVYEGQTVLVMDSEMSQLLSQRRLDVELTEQGPQLAVL